MQDQDKTKDQLTDELNKMRCRVAELETAQATALDAENAPLSYQSLDENGYFLAVNQAWLDTLGYSREEVIRKWFGDFLAPGYQDHFKINFPRFKAAGEIHGVEFEMVKKDGSIISVAFEGQIVRDQLGGFKQTHCIFQDITERKRTEEALRDSEEKYRNLFNNAEVGMFRTKLDGSEVLDVNDKFLKILNRTREEIVGKPSVVLWIDPHEREEMVRRLNTDGQVSDFEYRALTAQGEERTCLTSLKLYPETAILEGSIMDITDRKLLEEQKLEMERKLLHAQKLESLNIMAEGIAHDFNNQLAVVLGNLELALMDLAPDSEVRPGIHNAVEAAKRSADLSRQIQIYTGNVFYYPVDLDLNELLNRNPSLLKSCVSKYVTLNLEVGNKLPPIKADADQIQRLVMNILLNASEAIGDQDGEVRFKPESWIAMRRI